MTRYDLDWMISVDDHVLEPPDVWQTRVAARYRDRAPMLVTDSRGERWVYDGREVATSGLSAVVGKATTEFSPEPMSYAEMRPGCYDARARVFGCFIDDEVGVALLDYVGADNVMIETDYPHADSTWRGSRKLARQRLGHLPEDVQHKIMRGNAERLFRFTAPRSGSNRADA